MNKNGNSTNPRSSAGNGKIILIDRHLILYALLSLLLAEIFSCRYGSAATAIEVKQWLETHNSYRTLHGVSAFTWSKEVADSARVFADTCPSNHSGSEYGENLAWTTENPGIDSIVKMWYDEEAEYDFDHPGFRPESGHFTQIIWKSTGEIGCALKTGCAGKYPYVWICQYNPPGNYTGQFVENVFPQNPAVRLRK